MDSQLDGNQTKKKYAIITPTNRLAFIRRVQSKQSTIKQAAQEFGIKFSTSKAILQTYKREGRIGKKKTRTRKNTTKLDSKGRKQDEKFFQQYSDSIEGKSQQMCLQKVQTQQFQKFQLSLQMKPYLFLQNLFLQQNYFQTTNPQLMPYYWQLNNNRIQTLQFNLPNCWIQNVIGQDNKI